MKRGTPDSAILAAKGNRRHDLTTDGMRVYSDRLK